MSSIQYGRENSDRLQPQRDCPAWPKDCLHQDCADLPYEFDGQQGPV